MGVSGEAAPRTLQRNAVTDDLDASSYSAGIPHSLNTVEFIEPWTLDASMTLMTPNSRHEDMSDLSTEDILTLGGPMVTMLAEHGADVDFLDPDGCTPLYRAAESGNKAMVERLLRHGAKLS
ncbi:uncharacterized protein N0V96_001005 [Colletotrichum fioriniae]|uniref:uncharacterized protein n=1 Tax=Colletotrichum fioriniae TaxID=710243 RepID=UPI0032D9E5EA|nr:hypothetical protein N0V96_001005 [Colletotrichum fioriniae]